MRWLKSDNLLLGISVSAIFLSAFGLFFFIYQSRLPEVGDLNPKQITSLLNEFRRSHPVVELVSLDASWNIENPPDLVNPRNVLPQFDEKTRSELNDVLAAGEKCVFPRRPSGKNLQKMQDWFRFRCKASPGLSPEIWRAPPLIHPTGGSWAFWLFQNGYGDSKWLANEKKYLHVLELKHLPPELLSPLERIVSEFRPEELLYLLSNKGIVVTPKHVLIVSYYSLESTPLAVYSRGDWDRFLQKNFISMSSQGSSSCEFEDRMYCWGLDLQRRARLDSAWVTSLLLFVVIALSFAVIAMIWKRKRLESALIQNQQLVVQTLAHELRHPVTSFKLSIEAIRPFYDQLPDEVMPEFLRLISVSERMSRLVNYSRQYLQVISKDKEFSFQSDEVGSFQEFLENVLEDYQGKISIRRNPEDQSCRIDSYWLATCLKNLVINALTHGQPPIEVSWERAGDRLRIFVQDAGAGPSFGVEELRKPFLKNSNQGGMGLGLSLIFKLVSLMNGQLEIGKNPTVFVITLRGAFP